MQRAKKKGLKQWSIRPARQPGSEKNTVMDHSVESFSFNRLRNRVAARPAWGVIYFSSLRQRGIAHLGLLLLAIEACFFFPPIKCPHPSFFLV